MVRVWYTYQFEKPKSSSLVSPRCGRRFSPRRKLVCTTELERFAGGSLPAGRTIHAWQLLSELRDKERDSGRPGWGLEVGLTPLPHRNSVVSKPRQRGGHGLKTGRSALEEEGINGLHPSSKAQIIGLNCSCFIRLCLVTDAVDSHKCPFLRGHQNATVLLGL